jgi:hypothetical protein
LQAVDIFLGEGGSTEELSLLVLFE